ncbi:hypothetical protein [Echinimonas agarilytica]|uniref:Lipoprotein n=1 Tax=Echinimonas agarilytica TaxID=1215918 RepID=A0AA41W6P2_9GAMM|nr:hypothetical protein [Echinimonas agarilytica]MCM2679947.1 hypothetical protein [Echinimonas agarilytica]
MKILLCLASIVLLASCADQTDASPDLFFKQDGINIICTQQRYISCLGVTQEECSVQLAPHADMCMEQAWDNAHYKQDKTSASAISLRYGNCLLTEQNKLNDKVLQCFKDAKNNSNL